MKMRQGSLNREQAVKLVGEKMVEAVESENCDFTNRLQTDGDDAIEFSASVQGEDLSGEDCTLVAYYYQNQEDLDAAGDDLGNCNWEIEGYEIL
jgi:hypothetical protein